MSSQVEAALIAAVVSLISLGGTILVAFIGFRTTRSVTGSTLAEQRARTLNERFATAADKLRSDKPPAVRLAGVYAMAGLADGWPENRQVCVEVLCAYLRLPHESEPGDDDSAQEQLDFGASREVRHTVIRVIAAHLKGDAAVSWQSVNFDFTGVVFDCGSFSGAKFSGGEVDFSDPGDWSSPPKFAWIDIPPQGVKLPHKEDQSAVSTCVMLGATIRKPPSSPADGPRGHPATPRPRALSLHLTQ